MTKLTFLGTGTSQGVPVISCRCRVCRSADTRDKRLRTSAMVEQGGVRVIIDAGPDFRQQMLREGVESIDGILLTHEHKDHIAGIDDVRAFNFTSGRVVPVDIYSTQQVQAAVRHDYSYAFEENPYPGAPVIRLHTIDTQHPFTVGGMEVIPVAGVHYRIQVVGFRIGALAYLTDFKGIEDKELEKIKGVEILVINALRDKPHQSHFTVDEAVEIGRRAGAKRIYLTHLSHEIGLYQETLQRLPEGVFPAYDGLVVETTEA